LITGGREREYITICSKLGNSAKLSQISRNIPDIALNLDTIYVKKNEGEQYGIDRSFD
jgi:hypothetical protein